MSSGRVVPSLPDIHGIQDPAVRRYLSTLQDAWNVRSADAGSGDNKWLTKADLKQILGDDNYSLLAEGDTSRANQVGTATGRRRESVADTIRGLQQSIAGSKLSIYLAEDIKEIRKPNTGILARLGKNETLIAEEVVNRVTALNAVLEVTNTQFVQVNTSIAAIQQFQSTLANSFAAQSNLITTIESRLDNVGGVSMEERFRTLIDADNHLYAQYSIKVDLNGYVVGFGLSAEDNGQGPSSQFLVRADTFSVGAPGLNAQIPFIVKTTTWVDDSGRTRKPGIYSDAAFITNLTVDTADILDAAVDTLKIKGQAVTFPVSAQSGGGTVTPTPINIVSVSAQNSGAPVYAIACCSARYTGSDGHGLVAELQVDGVTIATAQVTLTAQSVTHVMVVSGLAQPLAGNRTYSMQLYTDNGQSCEVSGCTIFTLECKR